MMDIYMKSGIIHKNLKFPDMYKDMSVYDFVTGKLTCDKNIILWFVFVDGNNKVFINTREIECIKEINEGESK